MNSKIYSANAKDYRLIQSLLESSYLPLDGVKEHLSNFLVLKKENKVIGTVGLEVYGNKALLRSLVVAKFFHGKGYGKRLYHAILEKARAKKISEIYLLTETAESFFTKQGFEMISRNSVAPEVKKSVEFGSACPETASCMFLKFL